MSPCSELNLALRPLLQWGDHPQEPSTSSGRCSPTPFLGSCANHLLPWGLSDTLSVGHSRDPAKHSAGQLISMESTLSTWGWELTETCFCLSSPRQTDLTHFIGSSECAMCFGASHLFGGHLDNASWNKRFVSFLFSLFSSVLLFFKIRCSSKLPAIKSFFQALLLGLKLK